MTRISSMVAILLLAAFTGRAGAQNPPSLNEIYASHSGTDDQEYVELKGTPGMPLANHMVLVVEGDGVNAGFLDRVWDLSNQIIPASGFFVLGDAAVPNVNLVVGTTNIIENGTDTFYLVFAPSPDMIQVLLGTNVDPDGDGITLIPALATILDIIAMVDGGFPATDTIYDGALPIGPDGTFLPAGIYRGNDAPNGWCGASFLDFDDVVNLNQPRTPGGSNVACRPGTLIYRGFLHETLGQAAMHVDGSDHLVLSNIGSSGLDGVRIDVSETHEVVRGELVLPPIVFPPPNPCVATAFGSLAGVAGQGLSRLAAQMLPGPLPQVQITPDFSPLGATTSSVELFLGGALVFSQSGLSGPGCIFPIPPSCIGTCGSTLSRPMMMDIAFPGGPLPVTIPGGPTILADRIVLQPDSPTILPDFMTHVELVASDIPGFTILDEALGLFRRFHHALGQVEFHAAEGHLIVSDIGSSGEDGVSIDLADTDNGFEVSVDPVDLTLASGLVFEVEATGSYGGVLGSSLGSAGCMNNMGTVQAFANFGPIGASMVKVECYLNGQFQGSSLVPMGVVGDIGPGPGGLPRVVGCGKLPPDPPCYFVIVDPPGTILTTGGDMFDFDCVRLLAADAPSSIDFLSSYSLTGVGLGTLNLVGERERLRFDGLTHRSLGHAHLEDVCGTTALTLSNIGSSGLDGVSIDLGDLREVFSAEARPLVFPPPPGLSCNFAALGTLQGATSSTTLSTLRADTLPTGDVQVTPDFSPLGAMTNTVELFLGGSLVFSQSGLAGPGCFFPPPPSCVGTCGPGPGGPMVIAIEFPGPLPVSIPGGPTITADELRMIPDAPTMTADHVSGLVMTGLCPLWDPFLPLVELRNEAVGFFGRLHRAEGQAEFSPSGDHLTISNLGSSGCDGVSIDMGDTPDGILVKTAPIALVVPGMAISASAVGTFSGNPGSFLGSAGCSNNGGQVQAFANFMPIGASDVLVEVHRMGVLVGSAVVPGGGIVADVNPGPAGPAAIVCVGKLPPDPPCIVVALDQLASVDPVGAAGPFLGDEVRLLAFNAQGTIDSLSSFSMFGTDLPSLVLLDELSVPSVPLCMDLITGGMRMAGVYCTSAPTTNGPSNITSSALLVSVSAPAPQFELWADNLPVLNVNCAPGPQPGIFIASSGKAAIPFFNGTLCLDPPGLQRLQPVLFSDVATRMVHLPIDLATQAQAAVGGAPINVVPGFQYNFQYWTRDPCALAMGFPSAANFSSAIGICFIP